MEPQLLPITWPDQPSSVQAAVTTRLGGVSLPPYDEFNLGLHVGDDPQAVNRNREALAQHLALPRPPRWLNQVHGTRVARVTGQPVTAPADAAYTDQPGQPLCILTADCLPVLIASVDGVEVGAAHAGWRSLCDGVLEELVAQFKAAPEALTVWLGPAIGPRAFEVGPEVRAAFVARDAAAASAFKPSPNKNHPERWLADIYALARLRLQKAGVHAISGGDHCTVEERSRFYSYRRDGITGRMATLIWR